MSTPCAGAPEPGYLDPQPPSVPPMGLVETAVLFGGAALLLLAATHWLLPLLAERTCVEPVVLWFVVGGVGVMTPLLVAALVLLHREGQPLTMTVWRERLRFRAMTGGDWLWSLAGLAAIGALAACSMTLLQL